MQGCQMINPTLSSRFAPIWATKNGCRGFMYMNADQNIDARSSVHQDVIDLQTASIAVDFSHLDSDVLEAANIFFEEVAAVRSVNDDDNYYDVIYTCTEIHDKFKAVIDFYCIKGDRLTVVKYENRHTPTSIKNNYDLISQAIAISKFHDMTFESVTLTIVQPRAYSEDGIIKSIVLTDLSTHLNALKLAATECFLPSVKNQSGAHCGGCFARKECPAALNAGMQLFEVASDAHHVELSSDQMGLQLKIVDRAIQALKTLKSAYESQIEYTLGNGETVPGWELKAAYGRESWTETYDDVVALAESKGISVAKPTLITPKQARDLGFDTEGMTIKPRKGFKLSQSSVEISEIFSN